MEGLGLARNPRHRLEEPERLADCHVEDLGDRHPLVADVERLAVVTAAPADAPPHVDARGGRDLPLPLPPAPAPLPPAALALGPKPPPPAAPHHPPGAARP